MRLPLSVLIVCSIFANARAEPPAQTTPSLATPAASEALPPRFAFGLNAPVGWLLGSFGASGYVRIGGHFAVRANIAALTDGEVIGEFIPEAGHRGTITDYGIGGVWYPRRTWDGALIEFGALLRARNTSTVDADPEVTTRSTTYAGRALIGWSWLIRSSVFVAFAVGGSWGRESGRTTSVDKHVDEMMPMTSPLRRNRFAAESYLRFGVVFGS
jgi:hypothetical protein